MNEQQIEKYIERLVREGNLDPNCKTCLEIFYPQLRQGKKYTDIFAPRHMAMSNCRSGKYPHCTCDTCF